MSLKGVGTDILEDGSLDLPDSVLGRLGLVVGAIYSRFNLSADQQTSRIPRALGHPHFSTPAHLLDRLVGEHNACNVDLMRILTATIQRSCYVEANVQPTRLDLADIGYCLVEAKDVFVNIASDTHSSADLLSLSLSVTQAHQVWLGQADMLSTHALHTLLPLSRRTM